LPISDAAVSDAAVSDAAVSDAAVSDAAVSGAAVSVGVDLRQFNNKGDGTFAMAERRLPEGRLPRTP